jgi:hypothetical protein
MTTDPQSPRRWGVDQRLEFIEFRLFWDGVLNRLDIVDRFGVSSVQASSDLARYKEIAPENFDYDASQKRFLASDSFEPRLIKPNADRYLVQLKAIADKVIQRGDTNIGVVPVTDGMPVPHRRVDAQILRRIVFAIRAKQGMLVRYHSMNVKRPEPSWREITPHAFAFDGLRWHIRSYCHVESRFKDFILSRVLELGDEVTPGKLAIDDEEWNRFFTVVLVPNPKLAPAQQETVALDYGMQGGRLEMPVRCALLYYFNKRLRLDIAELVDNPKETPIVVENRADFERCLAGDYL